MDTSSQILASLTRLERRIEAMDQKLDKVSKTRGKSIEWIGTLSEQIESLDVFREEVRATFEPLFGKLEGIDELVRLIRHATADVSKRVEELEKAG